MTKTSKNIIPINLISILEAIFILLYTYMGLYRFDILDNLDNCYLKHT